MTTLPRALLAVGIAGAATLGPAAVALAAGSGSITTAPSAEAWFRTAPVCALPTGCPAETPSPYAADTLHIGVNLGQEEARTALALDLSALPPGTKPAGGQLRLPVASGTQDGTRNAEGAKMRACALKAPVTDADGSFEPGPEPDCDAASAEAVYVAATEQAPAAFTVDLTAIAAAWELSPAPGALVLVPAEETAPPDTWHVAVSGRDREGEDVATITAAVSYVSSAVDVEVEPPPPFVPAPVDTGTSEPFSFEPVQEPVFSAPSIEGPIVPAPAPAPAPAPQAAPEPVVPVASFVDAGFRYPAVFLLPLLFAIGAAWLGRALTRDLTGELAA